MPVSGALVADNGAVDSLFPSLRLLEMVDPCLDAVAKADAAARGREMTLEVAAGEALLKYNIERQPFIVMETDAVWQELRIPAI